MGDTDLLAQQEARDAVESADRAFSIVAKFDQEKIDRICEAMAMAALGDAERPDRRHCVDARHHPASDDQHDHVRNFPIRPAGHGSDDSDRQHSDGGAGRARTGVGHVAGNILDPARRRRGVFWLLRRAGGTAAIWQNGYVEADPCVRPYNVRFFVRAVGVAVHGFSGHGCFG